MEVKEVFQNRINFTSKSNLTLSRMECTFPNVEFGKTYYYESKDKHGMLCNMAVKFHGIRIWGDGYREIFLVGETAEGKTIVCRNTKITTFSNTTNEEYLKGLYYDRECQKVVTDEVTANIPTLINYLYPNQFNFGVFDGETHAFRYNWDGKKVIERKLLFDSLRSLTIFFTKPKKSPVLHVLNNKYQFKQWNNVEVGKIIENDNDNEGITDFINDTYYDADVCRLDNKLNVCDFEDEQEDEQEELVYIEYVGLVTKEKAEEILKVLKAKEI